MFLNNRYYNPSLGVFTSVDPLVATTGDPYLYAGGNPTTRSDPSGLDPEGWGQLSITHNAIGGWTVAGQTVRVNTARSGQPISWWSQCNAMSTCGASSSVRDHVAAGSIAYTASFDFDACNSGAPFRCLQGLLLLDGVGSEEARAFSQTFASQMSRQGLNILDTGGVADDLNWEAIGAAALSVLSLSPCAEVCAVGSAVASTHMATTACTSSSGLSCAAGVAGAVLAWGGAGAQLLSRISQMAGGFSGEVASWLGGQSTVDVTANGVEISGWAVRPGLAISAWSDAAIQIARQSQLTAGLLSLLSLTAPIAAGRG